MTHCECWKTGVQNGCEIVVIVRGVIVNLERFELSDEKCTSVSRFWSEKGAECAASVAAFLWLKSNCFWFMKNWITLEILSPYSPPQTFCCYVPYSVVCHLRSYTLMGSFPPSSSPSPLCHLVWVFALSGLWLFSHTGLTYVRTVCVCVLVVSRHSRYLCVARCD